ncbi:MAG: glucose-1-phosphate adenylyltransferase subunit GlgD, partial [Oscillospiraceae bacterium]|nr:glucose-1-phosphate adenylyltransferase subunit GlgD [Oscillospiraceae bacterium]
MNDFHGLIFAYYTDPNLRSLVSMRTAASLPFCGRYRLIDFSLSAMRNAGIVDVGVIMQRDYQSLLDHLGGGKAWDMARRTGGLRMLPPFGLPEYHRGNYAGTMEALISVRSYIEDIKAKYVVLMLGDMCANVDLLKPMEQHRRSGAQITAICTRRESAGFRMTYLQGEDGYVTEMLQDTADPAVGAVSMEAYIINKETLLDLMETSRKKSLRRFHKDTLDTWLKEGGKMDIYVHHGYTALIRSIDSYYKANMDMLNNDIRHELFPAERPVFTKAREEVSTYYGVGSYSRNSLVADNCIIEGSIEN